MRMIGHLPNETSAATFSDFLYVEGITNLVEAEKDGWAIWIHSEDQLQRARELFLTYLGNPKDPKYQKKSQQVAELKQREREEQDAAEKRTYGRSQIFRSFMPFGVGPLTFLLVLVCAAIWGLLWVKPDSAFVEQMFISHYKTGLPEVLHGEVWRLITPIFVHAWPSPFHLLFNVYALWILGATIEVRQGPWRLASLTLVIAALSNLGQYYVSGPNFCGISGVVYGLFGYIWMKGKFDPNSGYYVHPQTVMMMLLWFFLCLMNVMPGIANTVHAVGLVVGVARGFFASLPALLNRTR